MKKPMYTTLALLAPLALAGCGGDVDIQGDPGGMGAGGPDTAGTAAETPALDVQQGMGVAGDGAPREGVVIDTAQIDTTARIDG
jgi:hypothetical protein